MVVADTNESPEGIVSEKDVMRAILTDNSTRELKEIHAHEVMSSRLFIVKPHSPLSEAAEIMIRENISSLLVSGDQLEGIVTKADVANYLGAKKRRTQSVAQCMTPNPITATPLQSILSTIRLMSQNKISRVVVVDQNQELRGIITLADFTLLLLSFCFARIPAADLLKRTETIGLKARDFMTADPYTINQNSDLSEAARLMTRYHISGLPVTDDSTKLTGIVSKTDITRAVTSKAKKTKSHLPESEWK